MANRYENKDAQKSIGRMNDDLKLEKGTKNAVEAVLVGTIAEGRMGDATTIATLLGKATPMADLMNKMDMLMQKVTTPPAAPTEQLKARAPFEGNEPVVSDVDARLDKIEALELSLVPKSKPKKK